MNLKERLENASLVMIVNHPSSPMTSREVAIAVGRKMGRNLYDLRTPAKQMLCRGLNITSDPEKKLVLFGNWTVPELTDHLYEVIEGDNVLRGIILVGLYSMLNHTNLVVYNAEYIPALNVAATMGGISISITGNKREKKYVQSLDDFLLTEIKTPEDFSKKLEALFRGDKTGD